MTHTDIYATEEQELAALTADNTPDIFADEADELPAIAPRKAPRGRQMKKADFVSAEEVCGYILGAMKSDGTIRGSWKVNSFGMTLKAFTARIKDLAAADRLSLKGNKISFR